MAEGGVKGEPEWCPEGGSNSHSLCENQILSLARLPVPPSGLPSSLVLSHSRMPFGRSEWTPRFGETRDRDRGSELYTGRGRPLSIQALTAL